VAIFDGVNDKVISEEVRPYLFPSSDADVSDITPIDAQYAYSSYGFQTANPPMYCLAIPVGVSGGQLTRVLCYDLVVKSWTVVDLPFSISSAIQARAEGAPPTTVFGGFLDGTLQRWQAGDLLWYTGSSSTSVVQFGFRTQEMGGDIPDQRLYCRRVAITGYNNNSTKGLTVTIFQNAVLKFTYNSPPLAANDFEVFAPVQLTGTRFHADIFGSGQVEIHGDSWHIEPKPAGVPLAIS
jgi:hypothetical protein